MSAERHPGKITIADYLVGELDSDVRHEYLAGTVYAMSGGTAAHARISLLIGASLSSQLQGKPCQVFGSDLKVRVRSAEHTSFYYPDVSVICAPIDDEATFHDSPSLIVEVLSPSTRRTDEGEKKSAYLSMQSLSTYLLVEPDQPFVRMFHRGESGFAETCFKGLDQTIDLPEIDCSLSLRELYTS